MKQEFIILKNIQDKLIENLSYDFKRDIYQTINWNDKIIWLIWERWVWKTTILLQKLGETKSWFYFSADNPILKDIWLFKFIFFLNNELSLKTFYIDEIHKYKNWTSEMKSIYDSFPNVKVIFSGSSSLDLYKWILDLSRRVSFYKVHTMNYKEYLKLYHNINIPNFSLDEILKNHQNISATYGTLHKFSYFEDFIQKWQYPYLKEIEKEWYISKFQNLFDKIILEDLPVFINLQTQSLDKLRKLIYFIANSTPSELSFSLLSKKVWVDKVIIENVLTLLDKIWVISLIPKFWNLSERVRKEYKIFLWNTNLYNAYNMSCDIWVLRECFFVSQVKKIENMEIFTPKLWDFRLQIFDTVFDFEIWWKNKEIKKYWTNMYIVKDNIVISESEKIIPLWILWLIK